MEGVGVSFKAVAASDYPTPGVAPGNGSISLILVDTGSLAIAASAFRVWPSGCEFTLTIRIARHPNLASLASSLFDEHGPERTEPPMLAFGAEFADGRRCTSAGRPSGRRPKVLLEIRSGGIGEDGGELTLWLSPLPPLPSFRLFCEGTLIEPESGTAAIDAAILQECAARA